VPPNDLDYEQFSHLQQAPSHNKDSKKEKD